MMATLLPFLNLTAMLFIMAMLFPVRMIMEMLLPVRIFIAMPLIKAMLVLIIMGVLLPVVVINMEVRDSIPEAKKCAPDALKLCQMLDETDELEDELPAVLEAFTAATSRPLLHSLHYL